VPNTGWVKIIFFFDRSRSLAKMRYDLKMSWSMTLMVGWHSDMWCHQQCWMVVVLFITSTAHLKDRSHCWDWTELALCDSQNVHN